MAGKRRKKKRSIFGSAFYRVYFILVILALAGIFAGNVWLRDLLSDYESAQPVYVAEEVAALFERSQYDKLYALDTSAEQIAEGDEAFYVDSLSELTRGKTIDWAETFSSEEDVHKYAVTLDGDRFATFTLVPSGQTTGRGNRLWELDSVTTLVELQQPETPEPEPEPEEPVIYQCRITVPYGYSVEADGVTLGAENAQVTARQLFEEGFLPDSVVNPPMTEYLYDTANPAPQISAFDESGTPVQLKVSADREKTWSCPLKEDEGLREQYADAAGSLAVRVAKYISGDASKKAIQKICASGSPADAIFENLHNRYTTPHTGVSFRNQDVSEFYALSEDCFTCHVTFDFVMATKTGEKVYPTAYTFCVIRQNGKGKLYNLLIY